MVTGSLDRQIDSDGNTASGQHGIHGLDRSMRKRHGRTQRKLGRGILVLAFLFASPMTAVAALAGTGATPDQLLTIDTTTGAGTAVGPLGFSLVDGLAFDPISNTLYGSELTTDQLLTIDTTTGAGTAIGPLNRNVTGLAFDVNTNTLYGSDDQFNRLITINTTTAAVTAVGALGFSSVLGLAFDPFTNTLYGSDDATNQLLTIDTTTGLGTAIGPLGFDSVMGLAFDPFTNTLYGSDFNTAQLLAIDPITGAGTAVGPLGFSVLGLAPSSNIPEPSSLALSGLGLLALGYSGIRHRRKKEKEAAETREISAL